MRTTLTIDDQLLGALRAAAQRDDRAFKDVVNEALRLGLHAMEHPRARPYRLKPASLGLPRPGADLDRALALADRLEDESVAAKLEMRK
ncbi:MAG: DUF2191 domain-containing protein [Ectothiorhodospiraceae bacterium]|nr:DUF2191 domain-containing protein [Ectothiorhodospiraceae bacterium]